MTDDASHGRGSRDARPAHARHAEHGDGFKISPVTIRPLFGLGNATFIPTGTLSGSTSSSSLYLAPGGLIQIDVGYHVIVGVDASALILTSIAQGADGGPGTSVAFAAHGQVGLKL